MTDPLKDALHSWQVNPPLDPNLTYKVRQKAILPAQAWNPFAPKLILANEAMSPNQYYAQALTHRKNLSTTGVWVLALVVIVSGFTGGVMGQRQKTSDTQAMASLYLSKINPM